MAKEVRKANIPVDKIYKISDRHTWALDFYNRKPVQITSLGGLQEKEDIWVFANEKELQQLKDAGVDWDEQLTVDQFRITRLQIKFLEPNTRYKKLNQLHLVHLK